MSGVSKRFRIVSGAGLALVLGFGLTGCPPAEPGGGSTTTTSTPPGQDCTSAPNIPIDKYMGEEVSELPVDTRSATWMSSIVATDPNLKVGVSSGRSYDNVFRPPGFPVNFVPNDYPLVPWTINLDVLRPVQYPSLDGVVWQGYPDPLAYQYSDAYLLTVFADCRSTEQIGVSPGLGAPNMYDGVRWDADYTPSVDPSTGLLNGVDAAHVPLTTAIYRSTEALNGTINHVGHIATTVCSGGAPTLGTAFIWPARSTDCTGTYNPANPPYGAWMRLRADYPVPSDARAAGIVKALKTYGAVIGDGGSNLTTPTIYAEEMPQSTITALESIPWSDFDFVDAQGLRADPTAAVGDADYWDTASAR
ncbi:MAG: hypothetical protein R2698_07375 [Microthrixaceae bacterium]